MNGYVHLWQYLAEFSLEWEIFQTKFVEKIKTHMLRSITVTLESCRLWDNVENYGKAGQATGDNIIRRMCLACGRFIPSASIHPLWCPTNHKFIGRGDRTDPVKPTHKRR